MWPSFVKSSQRVRSSMQSSPGRVKNTVYPSRVEARSSELPFNHTVQRRSGLALDLTRWHHAREVPELGEAGKHGHPRTRKLSWAATTS